MHVGLLSGQVFSPFGEHWLAGSHGDGGITSGILCVGMAWAFGIGAAALLKAVWWGMRLASLLTHLSVTLSALITVNVAAPVNVTAVIH